jgi:signal transduction histidine kinase
MAFILYDETMRVRHSNRLADGRTRRTVQCMTLGEIRLERLELGDVSSPSLICGTWYSLDEWLLEIRITIPEELFAPFFRRIAIMQGLSFIAETGIYSAEDGIPAWEGFPSPEPGLSAFAGDFPPRKKGVSASWERKGTSTKYRILLPWTGTEQRSTYFRTPQILFIQLDFDAMKSIFSKHRTALLGAILLFSATVLLLFWNVANETSRPFSHIAEEMLRFAALKERFSKKTFSGNTRITEIIDLEQAFDSMSEEVAASLEKMRQADKMKSHFLSVVSHELRTPLTSILGFSKLLRRRLESVLLPALSESDRGTRAVRDSIEELDIIYSEAERLTTLINDLLDMAKLDAGKMEWHMEWYSLSEVTEQALAATRVLFNENLVSVRSSVDRSLPALYGDRRRILQVLLNLLSNAAKFTLAGEVLVSATLLGEEIEVSVADTGIGIPPENLLSIFEKFRQVNEGPEQHHRGQGSGFPSAGNRGISWRTDLAENAPSGGSIFRFTLPVRTGEEFLRQRIDGDNGAFLA